MRYQAASRTLWCIAVGVCGDRGRADDLVQDAAMIALQKLDDFDASTNFTAWMGRIVRNLALNAVRRTVRRRTHPAGDRLDATADRADGRREESDEAPVDSCGRLLADQQCFDDEVSRALGELDDNARACLLMRTVLGLPYEEIARALDIPSGTAMSHVHRARKAMRTRLQAAPAPASSMQTREKGTSSR